MDFETERICLNQIVGNKDDIFSVEENIIIPDVKPDILSAVNSSGNVYVYKKELVNGKIRIDGGIQIYVMYIADNEQNNIRALNTVIDFSQNIDVENIEENMNFNCNLNIKDIECKILNGRKINVKANIAVQISVFSNTEKQILKSIENVEKIQMISNQEVINSLKGYGETIAVAKDTISLDNNIADIFDTDICVKNRDLKISYNKVLSKADVIVEILYLTEDEKISTATAQIPIMGFIDINDISDNDICESNYEIRNINIKPNNTEENTISIEIEFLISCSGYESREINLIQDLYSPEQDIRLNEENVCLMQNKCIMEDECKVQENINIPDIKNSKIYSIKVIPRILKQNIFKGKVSYEAELTLEIMFESNTTNRIEVREQKVTFTHVINSDNIEKDFEICTNIEVVSKDFLCMSDNTVEINVVLKFLLDMFSKNDMSIVNNVTVEDFKDECKGNSLIIYFVKEGDTLWKIAKKFRSTIDEIAQINNIENMDKINVGEQLYIPKYVCNRIS